MSESTESPKYKVRVYHSYYGCDTGCCGHVVEIPELGKEKFEFSHPYSGEEFREYAIGLARKVIKDYWPDCLPSIDWNSLEIDEISDY